MWYNTLLDNTQDWLIHTGPPRDYVLSGLDLYLFEKMDIMRSYLSDTRSKCSGIMISASQVTLYNTTVK